MVVVLDTNVVSEALKPRPEERVLSYLEEIEPDTRLTSITKAELLYGVHSLPSGRRRRDLLRAVGEAIAPYESDMLPFDSAAAAEYARLTAGRAATGRTMPVLDAQIAAICLANDAALVTRNVTDFDGCGIDLVNPWEL